MTPTVYSIHVAQVSIPTSLEKKQTLASRLAEQAGLQMGDGKIPAKYHIISQYLVKKPPTDSQNPISGIMQSS